MSNKIFFVLFNNLGSSNYITDLADFGFYLKMNTIESAKKTVNINVHVCDVCKKGFGCKSKLKTHMMVNTDEKDFYVMFV